MRQIDSIELLNKFKEYSSDVEHCHYKDSKIKIDHFFNFLLNQEISKRVFERIDEDFEKLKEQILSTSQINSSRSLRELKEDLVSRELQGAFGYFTILDKFHIKNKYSKDYIDLVRDWDYYGRGGDYNDFKEDFIIHFFKPFTELFEWYLKESETIKEEDYFSFDQQDIIIKEIVVLRESLGRIELKLDLTGQILDSHLEDLEKLVKKLNKKNLIEIIRGKFGDEILSKLISIEAFTKLIETITGEKLNLIN